MSPIANTSGYPRQRAVGVDREAAGAVGVNPGLLGEQGVGGPRRDDQGVVGQLLEAPVRFPRSHHLAGQVDVAVIDEQDPGVALLP
jgi:hypothetical protein